MTKWLIILGIIPVFLWSGGGFMAVMLWILACGAAWGGWVLTIDQRYQTAQSIRKKLNSARNWSGE